MKRRIVITRPLSASQRCGLRVCLERLEDRTAPAVFSVTNTADSGPGSLRQAILDANASASADRITFDPTVFATARTVQMIGASLTITNPVSIEGPAAGLTLDAGGLSGHFTLALTHALDPVAISGLTLTHAGGGASVADQNASLSLSRMVITNNMAVGISVGVMSYPGGWGWPYGWYYTPGSDAKLSLADSTVSDNTTGYSGSPAGINVINGEADVIRSIITGNNGDYGGGIGVGTGYIGFAQAGGAGFAGQPSLTLTDSVVDDNTAIYQGGGINVSGGNATIIHSTITGNLAGLSDLLGTGGGGVCFTGGLLTITRSTIAGNSAESGGGIEFYDSNPDSQLVMEETTVSRNKAILKGGGVYLYGHAVIRNSTISGNVAGGGGVARGGGLALSSASLDLQNSTVAFNTALQGTGGGIDNSESEVRLRNVILSGNYAPTAGHDLNGEARVDFSLISSISGAFVTGFNNLLDIDARLGPLADNGGPTRTHRPGPGSPVRNTGGDTAGLISDQRGPGFSRILQSRPDMGAVESTDPTPVAIPTVPTVTAAGGTVYVILVSYADDTAIRASSLGTGDLYVSGAYGSGFFVTPTFVWADVNSDGTPRLATYVFNPPGGAWGPEDNGTYIVYLAENQVFDTDAPPRSVPFGVIGKFAVEISTTFIVDDPSDARDWNVSPGHLTLREAVDLANLYPGSRDTITFSPAAFASTKTIALASGEIKITGPVTIIGPSAGLTLDGGGRSRLFDIDMVRPGEPVSISGLTLTNGSAQTGGAVRNIDATLSLARMRVTNNVATGAGGGIAVTGGSLTLADSTVSENSGGGLSVSSSATITGSTISGNSTAVNGGGVYLREGASLTMTDCTVSGNTARRGSGGGLELSYATTVVIRNSTIAYNIAIYGGGTSGGTPILQSTIVAQNAAILGSDMNGRVTATFSLIGNASRATLDAASANNLLNLDPLLGPLANNGGPTWTHALLPGSPAVNAGSNPANLAADQRGAPCPRVFESAADIGAFEVQQSTIPSVVVNAGQPNPLQRSMVTSLTVTFGGLVTFAGPAASAFRLQRSGPYGTLADVTLTVDLAGSTAMQTVARLTFSGAFTEGANSLIDGNYALTVLSGQVNGGLLGGDSALSLFRLFGDLNGDKTVNGLDLAAFRTAFGASNGDANYRPELDFDGDGDVNGLDLAVFRTRFGVVLP